MTNRRRPLALAAALVVILGATVASAQTVIVRGAPAGSRVELVFNADVAGSAAADAAGDATLPFKLATPGAKPEIDARIFVDVCSDVRRVLLVGRGQQAPVPGSGCDRREILGVFLIRRVSTVVVNVGGLNPTVLLIQGPFDPRVPVSPRSWSPSPDGLILLGAGNLAWFNNATVLACGDTDPCGRKQRPGFSVAAAYWITPVIGAEVGYVRPADVKIEGSGTGFRFTSTLEPEVVTIAGKVGAPVGPVRIYGKAGGVFHRALLGTTQTIDDTTITVDGVTQVVKGGTQRLEMETEGWGWLFGGGLEVWLNRSFAIYTELQFAKLQGDPVNASDGRLDERMTTIAIGAQVRIPGLR